MITYVQGDLFRSPADVLVNTVNTVGVMGKGIALEFKHFYPEMFAAYQQACEAGVLRIGTLMLYRDTRKSVLNFPTKRDWRSPSQVEDIEAGLKKFVASYKEYGISSIAFPQLGCGNGGLDWESQVRPLMERYLCDLPIRVYIHLYDEKGLLPEHHDRKSMKTWLRSEPESLPASEAWNDLVQVAKNLERLDEWSVSVENETVPREAYPDRLEQQEVEAIRFHHGEASYALIADDFLPLWQQLRTFGLLSEADAPAAARVQGVPMLALLGEMEYLVETCFVQARMDDRIETPQLEPGLKLVPGMYRQQPMLIAV